MKKGKTFFGKLFLTGLLLGVLIVLPACFAWDGGECPAIRPLFDYYLRDVAVCVGGDGYYYMTGTTGYPTWWTSNDGIRLWRSSDLVNWTDLGLVWTMESNGTRAKAWVNNQRARTPELDYINGTYWIAYCMNYGGTGLLKSTSGLPTGPYADVKADGPLTSEIDPSLLQDDDGKVYFRLKLQMLSVNEL